MKVNPVTGKMEKVDPTDGPAGKHRDGCLLVDDRYVNAAKDLGLGNDKGARRALAAAPARGFSRRPRPCSFCTQHGAPSPPLPQACTAT